MTVSRVKSPWLVFIFIFIALLCSGCTSCSGGAAGVIPTCNACTGLGGAWLPESNTCADTCEEQDEGVLCVERVCPGEGATTRAQATTCEECILLGGTWRLEEAVCGDTCDDGVTCFTHRCPDGGG